MIQINCQGLALGYHSALMRDLNFCEVSLENTKQIPSYPKTRGYTKGYALRYFFISAFIFSLAAVTARPTDCWLQCSIFPISL